MDVHITQRRRTPKKSEANTCSSQGTHPSTSNGKDNALLTSTPNRSSSNKKSRHTRGYSNDLDTVVITKRSSSSARARQSRFAPANDKENITTVHTPEEKSNNNLRARNTSTRNVPLNGKENATTPRMSSDRAGQQEAEEDYSKKKAPKKTLFNTVTSIVGFLTPKLAKESARNSKEPSSAHKVEPPLDSQYIGPTDLHNACYTASSWEDVRYLFSNASAESDLRKADENGRNPLHLLGMNGSLASSLGNNSSNMDEFVSILVPNMKSLLSQDKNGHVPFEEVIVKWINEVRHVQLPKMSRLNALQNLRKLSVHGKQQSTAGAGAGAGADLEEEQQLPEEEEDVLLVELPLDVACILHLASDMLDGLQNFVARDGLRMSTMSPISSKRWARFQKKSGLKRQRSFDTAATDEQHILTTIDEYEVKFASIKNSFKTFLLIDDAEDRRVVFNYSIIKRVMLRKESLGKWLSDMFQDSRKDVGKRAIDYLVLLSDVLENEGEMECVHTDKTAKDSRLNELYDTLAELDGLIPSMLALDKDTIEDAATTPLMTKGMITSE